MHDVRVSDIAQHDERTLKIQWTDGHIDFFDVVNLRRECPCADCIHEVTGERILKPEDVSEDVRPVKIGSVGNYALSIEFSDGHKTGLYSCPFLWALGAKNQKKQ